MWGRFLYVARNVTVLLLARLDIELDGCGNTSTMKVTELRLRDYKGIDVVLNWRRVNALFGH